MNRRSDRALARVLAPPGVGTSAVDAEYQKPTCDLPPGATRLRSNLETLVSKIVS